MWQTAKLGWMLRPQCIAIAIATPGSTLTQQDLNRHSTIVVRMWLGFRLMDLTYDYLWIRFLSLTLLNIFRNSIIYYWERERDHLCGRLAESKFWSPCVLRFADGLSISLVRTDFYTCRHFQLTYLCVSIDLFERNDSRFRYCILSIYLKLCTFADEF